MVSFVGTTYKTFPPIKGKLVGKKYEDESRNRTRDPGAARAVVFITRLGEYFWKKKTNYRVLHPSKSDLAANKNGGADRRTGERV